MREKDHSEQHSAASVKHSRYVNVKHQPVAISKSPRVSAQIAQLSAQHFYKLL